LRDRCPTPNCRAAVFCATSGTMPSTPPRSCPRPCRRSRGSTPPCRSRWICRGRIAALPSRARRSAGKANSPRRTCRGGAGGQDMKRLTRISDQPQHEATVKLLALDLGTTTGFCLGSARHIISGTASFKPGRFEGGGMRYVRFQNWLSDMAGAGPFDRVAFEEVRRHAGTDAAHVYGGLMATLTAWCEEHQVPYEGIPV